MTTDDLKKMIDYHNNNIAKEYRNLRDIYKGQHEILQENKRSGTRPDNRLVVNLAHYVVETFSGFFIGIPPKITLDSPANNKALQSWQDTNSFQDKLAEISKQSDIYGRSIAFVYQDEFSETKVTYVSPENAFIIYDNSIIRNPIAFVRYMYDDENKIQGAIYFADESFGFNGEIQLKNGEVNPLQKVPAVEFYNNEDRQGLIDNIETLVNALDKAMSQKSNQNEYFDNAYLKILGLELAEDEKGNPILNLDGQQVIYSKDDKSKDATVEFITKPDGDNMQEHLIDRLIDLTYQVSMVANLNDSAFSGNSSGVALEYKLLPMKNMAMNKERKFTQSLRKLYSIIFSVGTVLPISESEAWQDLKFKFIRNLPINLADETATARNLEGIVSKETQLSTLSIIDDPKAEIERINEETANSIKNAKKASEGLTDKDSGDLDE